MATILNKDKCLLCHEGKPYQIKSHLTPAGITENTYGERNKEEIYTIDAEEKTIDKYYGPQHSQTESTEVKPAPNSRKGIFCKECETKFSNYESEVQDKLNDLVNSLGRGGYKIYRTDSGVKYLEIGIHSNILMTYFQSVIWRQCIEQLLDGKDNPLSDEQLEQLRLTVLNNISIPVKKIVDADLSNNPKISIFTTYGTDLPNTSSFANPSPLNTNPLLFFVGAVNLLYWNHNNITPGFSEITKIPEGILTEELQLDNSRIGIINIGTWTKINSVLAQSVAKKFVS